MAPGFPYENVTENTSQYASARLSEKPLFRPPSVISSEIFHFVAIIYYIDIVETPEKDDI